MEFGKYISITIIVSHLKTSGEMSSYICDIFLLYNEICQHLEDLCNLGNNIFWMSNVGYKNSHDLKLQTVTETT